MVWVSQAGWNPSCERRESRTVVLRRSEQTRFIVCKRRRSRRIPSAMREQLKNGVVALAGPAADDR